MVLFGNGQRLLTACTRFYKHHKASYESFEKRTPESLPEFNEEQLTSLQTLKHSLLSPTVLKLPLR